MAGMRLVQTFAKVSLGIIGGLFPVYAEADCISPGFNPGSKFCDDCTYEGSMMLSHDQVCERPYNPSSSSPIEIMSNRIVHRAKHGIAGVNGNTFAYSPAKGFVGQDEFLVEVRYKQAGQSGKFFVHWTITVR